MNRPRLLFLTSRFPYPLEKGDKLRAYHFIRQFSRDFDVYLFAVNETVPAPSQVSALAPWCREQHTAVVTRLQSVGSMLSRQQLPFQVAYFHSKAAQRELETFVARIRPDVVFCHLIRMAEYARRIPAAVKVMDYMDAFAKGMERYRDKSGWLMKIPAQLEYQRLRRYEEEVFNIFNYHTIISEQDRGHIHHPQAAAIDVIPNGVDFDYFHPIEMEKQYDILFSGHLSYPPNITSAVFTAREIFPLLKKARPEASALIAGADPVQKVRALGGEGVTIRGWMDDIREAFAQSRVMVAPMLISIGLQNKILQAMIMKIPCVISPMANNALGAVHGREVFVANTPEEYNTYIQQLLNDPVVYVNMAENGYRFIRDHFSWEHHTNRMSHRIQQLLDKPRS